MGDDTPTEVGAERVDDGKVTEALVSHRRWIYSIGVRRCQEWNERGTRHLHTRNLAARAGYEKPRACNVRFVHATFFAVVTSALARGDSLALEPQRAPVAQWIEQLPSKQLVAGSNPAGRATIRSLCVCRRSPAAIDLCKDISTGSRNPLSDGRAIRRPSGRQCRAAPSRAPLYRCRLPSIGGRRHRRNGRSPPKASGRQRELPCTT